MEIKKTESIKIFLDKNTHPDLAAMYNHDMECQVIVAQGRGERIEGEYEGKKWTGFTDGDQTWKSFRVPWNAWHNPSYTDKRMSFDLASHVEGIGMTGWDWKSKRSRWVAFDFDAITGHSERHTRKMNLEELERVRTAAMEIDWVTVRLSTSGTGLHLYVFLDDIETQNHTEHAALARSILGKMSALTGFDFESKVDICGGNMWIWHRKMAGTEGLQIIKKGTTLQEVPPNWKDHLNVVKGSSRRTNMKLPMAGDLPEINEKFDSTVNKNSRVPLDAQHVALMKYLEENATKNWWWDADRFMLITHTRDLQNAHNALNLRGIFKTISKGTSEQNCFAFPLRGGAWAVRRYSLGVEEDPSWDQDGQQWTRCYYNRDPDLRTASMANEGVEDPSGGYVFRNGDDAKKAALALGAAIDIPAGYDTRQTWIKLHKDGKRITVQFEATNQDAPERLKSWLKKGKFWVKIFQANVNSKISEIDTEDFDAIVRHLVTTAASNAGWALHSDEQWHDEPLDHVKQALASMGLTPAEIKTIIGGSVMKPWKLVTRPFEPEYPGNRQWNRKSPQLRYPMVEKDNLHYPTWMTILDHVGKTLTPAIKNHDWCKANGILTGSDYLKCWAASLIQAPLEPLPYLFIYGEAQNTGKSMFHEALSLLFYPGYQRADQALTNASSFNAELEGAILCVVEEIDLTVNKSAYNRIKDWVTARQLPIHRKGETPYHIENATHWVQCANERSACPIFSGDTRIMLIHIPDAPASVIPKRELVARLEKEAPDFTTALRRLEIPSSNDRLYLPVIETDDKVSAAESNRNALEVFISEHCFYVEGAVVSCGEFYDKFRSTLDPVERFNWNTKQSVSSKMPERFPKGRLTNSSTWHWGNISFIDENPVGRKLVAINQVLREELE